MALRLTHGDQCLRCAVCRHQSRLFVAGLKLHQRRVKCGEELLGHASETNGFAFGFSGGRRLLAHNRHVTVVLHKLEYCAYPFLGLTGLNVDLPAQIALLRVKGVRGEKVARVTVDFEFTQIG